MTVNGYQIREAIKRWMLLRDTVQSQFKDSLHTFGDDELDKKSPVEIMKLFETADYNVARLEQIQQKFNQIVMVPVQEKSIPLALAVKLVGGAGRREKMWREAAVPKKDRYSYRDELSRNKDTEYARPTLPQNKCLEFSQKSSVYASSLRNAIAKGNSNEVSAESIGLTEDDYKVLFN